MQMVQHSCTGWYSHSFDTAVMSNETDWTVVSLILEKTWRGTVCAKRRGHQAGNSM